MKQKIIKTDKATLLVVELPECRGVISDNQGKRICFHAEKGWDWIWQPNDMFGKLQLLGRLPDITEEQADGAVEKVVFEDEEFGDIIKYRDYTAIPIGKHNKRYAPITALNSLSSLLQANEVYFENPLGKLHPTHPAYTGQGITVEEWLEKCKKWQEAQSKVWDKERTYLFIKVE